VRRIPARILLICILIVNLLPLTALADNQLSEPSKPYERVVSKLGSWYSSHRQHANESFLVTDFTGAYEAQQDEILLQFELRERVKITAIHVPFVAPEFSLFGEPEFVLVDNEGNIYSGFIAELSPRIRSDSAIEPESDVNSAILVFIPQQDIVLPAGSYTIQINSGKAQPVPAFLVRGYNFAAYEEYTIAMQQFLLAQKQDDEIEKQKVDFGRDFLDELEEHLRQQEISDELIDKESLVEAFLANVFVPPMFHFEESLIIDKIILNTYNEGLGAEPGIVYIIDEKGNEVAAFQAEGFAVDEVPNALWVVYPSILLPAGTYFIDMSNQEVLGYDENLEPLFFVGASIPAEPPINVTGTYRINLDVFLTSTLMGPVTETESSFSLEDFQLTVLDKGSTIELIGRYEDMPFSQNSEVIERTENGLVAVFNFRANLTETPYNADIGASVEVTILLRPGLMPEIRMSGEGTYTRVEDLFNMDHNTYDIVVTGVKFSEILPPFVMAAIEKAYGVGNIPGPNSPLEAAAGILFPPLVGVVVSVIQDMLKPRVRDLAWYREQHPGVRDEILALMMMGDALAASGGDPGDPISGRVSGEVPSDVSEMSYQYGEYSYEGKDYQYGEYPYEEEGYQYSEHTYESAENTDWMPAQGDVVISEEVSSLDNTVVPEAVPAEEREYMVVRTGVLGSTTLIYRDSASGEWISSRTGNVFNLELHQRNFPEQVRQYNEQRARNLELERTGQTSFQQAMREREKNEQREAYLARLAKKYGTSDKKKIAEIISERQQVLLQKVKDLNKTADSWDRWYNRAKVVEVVADVAIEAGANMVPGGHKVRAVYKLIKGIASNTAENGINVRSVVSGGVRGLSSAATDFIENNRLKARLTIAGEVVAGAIQHGTAGAKGGLVSGVTNAAIGGITDKIGKDGFGSQIRFRNLKNTEVHIAVKSGRRWARLETSFPEDVARRLVQERGATTTRMLERRAVRAIMQTREGWNAIRTTPLNTPFTEEAANRFMRAKYIRQARQSAAQLASGLTDRFVVQPRFTEPIQEMFKEEV
jgi:hypothetical protein